MSERRRLLMAQGEDNPWEKIDYLTLVPLNDESVSVNIKLSYIEFESRTEIMYFEYSFDGVNWTNVSYTQININIPSGSTLKLRGNLSAFLDYLNSTAEEIFYYNTLRIQTNWGQIAVAGTPMSLLSISRIYTDFSFVPYSFFDDALFGLFNKCTGLVKVLNPRTFLLSLMVPARGYMYMFSGCTSLINAPELPATALSLNCYGFMFEGCTSLVDAPELPATNLASSCYQAMFSGCTSLVDAPELPATTLADSCYRNMFNKCTSLVNAPELPATSLITYCYRNMFSYCSSLKYIKAMFLTSLNNSYTSSWVYGVSSTGTFVTNKNATWGNAYGDDYIPSGWTVITE